MKRAFQRMWDEIRRGENVEVYLLIFLSFSTLILNTINIVPSEYLSSITFAVLGLLAISTLGNRYHVERYYKNLTQSASSIFSDDYPIEWKEDFEEAKDLCLVGVRLARTIRGNYLLLEQKLKKGHKIRVLVVHPDGSAIEMAAARNIAPSARDTTILGAEIRRTLQLLADLRQINPDCLEVRTILSPLTFGAMGINMKSVNGVLYLEHFPYRTGDAAVPKFTLHSKDGRWYEFSKDEIINLWEHGLDWHETNSP